MLTPRDKLIIEYITEHKQVSFIDLVQFFSSEITARRRLNMLVDRGHLKRKKDIDDRYYVYMEVEK